MKHRWPLVALGWIVVGAVACSSSPGAEDGPEETEATGARRALLDSIANRVIVPTFEALQAEAADLRSVTEAYDEAVRTGGGITTSARAAARAAFADFTLALQAAELLQLGPYGNPSRFTGGLGIRDEMYSWPIVSACRVDQETVEAVYEDPDFFDRELPNVYGADALERLLFAEGTDNACPDPHPINQDETWRELVASGLERSRAAYAARVAERLLEDATRARDAWTGGFADQLRAAGEAGSAYRTTQEAVDQLFASMFYLDRQLKDAKLGAPLGITALCTSDDGCPDLLESQHAALSLEWARANLSAFEQVFFGGGSDDAEAYGFDDLLEASGAPDLAARMRSNLEAARDAGADVPAPLRDHLDSPEARALHAAIQAFATDLKTQFVSVLALRLPNEGAADND